MFNKKLTPGGFVLSANVLYYTGKKNHSGGGVPFSSEKQPAHVEKLGALRIFKFESGNVNSRWLLFGKLFREAVPLEKHDPCRSFNRIVPRFLGIICPGAPGKQAKMIYFVSSLILSLVVLFAFGIRGIPGAVILGLVAAGADFCWQWLRMKLMQRKGTKWLLIGVFSGFALRILNVLLFLKLAERWLERSELYIFVLFLLIIPVWSIIESQKLKKMGTEDKNGSRS